MTALLSSRPSPASGADKTLLTSTLTLDLTARGLSAVGDVVALNGAPFARAAYVEHCAVVTQDDKHWAFLT